MESSSSNPSFQSVNLGISSTNNQQHEEIVNITETDQDDVPQVPLLTLRSSLSVSESMMGRPPTPLSPTTSGYSSTLATALTPRTAMMTNPQHHQLRKIKKQHLTTIQAIINEYCIPTTTTEDEEFRIENLNMVEESTPSSTGATSATTNPESTFSEGVGSSYDQAEYVHKIRFIRGLQHHFYLEIMFWILVLLTAGLLLVCCRWIRWLKAYLTYTYSHGKGESFERATKVLVESEETREWTVCKIRTGFVRNYDSDQRVSVEPIRIRYFVYRYVVFLYDPVMDNFQRTQFNTSLSYSKLHKLAESEVENERDLRELLFGKNSTETPIKSVVQILLDEILHPFYLFQVFSIAMWFVEQYYIYCASMGVVSFIVVSLSFLKTMSNLQKLKEMTSYHCFTKRLTQRAPSSFNRTIYSEERNKSNEEQETMDSLDLIPGDLIEIDNDMVLPCDVILLSGQVIVNESMLNGDSVPVKKRPLPHDDNVTYNSMRDSIFTLYSGTRVMLTKPSPNSLFQQKCFGIVSQTGFNTVKGRQILSILFPKTAQFNIYRDALRFLSLLFITGFAGILGTIINLARIGAPFGNVIMHIFDLIPIIIPPALPIAMTTTIAFTMRRLGKRKILCTSPPRVNLSGYIKLALFDKTNTLTQSGIDICGILPCSNGNFLPLVKSKDFIKTLGHEHEFIQCLACCNNINMFRSKYIGDPLDIKLFQSSAWILSQQGEPRYSAVFSCPPSEDTHLDVGYTRIAVFDFQSSLQRMSVVMRDNISGDLICFAKGSAETITSISLPSGLPAETNTILKNYALKGYRVIACAYKRFSAHDISHLNIECLTRDFVESDMEFLGFVCMENKLKKGTSKAIQTLNDCNIKCIMVSGDSPYTSISVSRKARIISKSKVIYLSELSQDKDSNLDLLSRIRWRNLSTNQEITCKELTAMNFSLENIELATTGDVFEVILNAHKTFVKDHKKESYINTVKPSLLHILLTSCYIYSRFSPYLKKALVEELQKMGYCVGMVGDGVNDYVALKTAHVGISLAPETSIAAPFNSIKTSVGSLVTVIREGRASLLTFFQIFKFLALYSIIHICAILVLLQRNCNLSNFQYLYVDLFVVLPTTLLLTRTDASLALKREKPPDTLLSRFVLISVLGQIILSAGLIWMVWFDSIKEPWFVTTSVNPHNFKEKHRSHESTIIFFISTFCIINVAISMSISKPFKLPIITNNCK